MRQGSCIERITVSWLETLYREGLQKTCEFEILYRVNHHSKHKVDLEPMGHTYRHETGILYRGDHHIFTWDLVSRGSFIFGELNFGEFWSTFLWKCMYECMKTLSFWLFKCMHVLHVWIWKMHVWMQCRSRKCMIFQKKNEIIHSENLVCFFPFYFFIIFPFAINQILFQQSLNLLR